MNSIDIGVDFSYQGKHYTPSITLDLDNYIDKNEASNFYQLIAATHQIDTYSYLYEVMESSTLNYTNPQGLAVSFFQENDFDLADYKKHWEQKQILNKLQKIFIDEGETSDLDENPALKNMLLKAYQLGVESI